MTARASACCWIAACSIAAVAFVTSPYARAAVEQVVPAPPRAADRIAAGGTLLVSDAVAADVMLAGGRIALTGSVGGDYLGAGGEQDLAGPVAGSVRAAGGEIRLRSTVGRNATMAGGRIRLEPSSAIGGNAYLAGGDLRIDGAVDGTLRATGGVVVINGGVAGDADVRAGRLHLGPTAHIGGDLRHSVAPENVTLERGARVGGQILERPRPAQRAAASALVAIWHAGFLLAGAVAVALFPHGAAAAAAMVRRPGAAAGYGLLWVIGVPLAAVVLMMSVIGIPLAMIGLLLYIFSLYLARTAVAVWLGHRLLGRHASDTRGGLVLAFALGALVLIGAGMIPVAGPLMTVAAGVLGLGAVALALRHRRAEDAAA